MEITYKRGQVLGEEHNKDEGSHEEQSNDHDPTVTVFRTELAIHDPTYT